jgi:hypothetical protein
MKDSEADILAHDQLLLEKIYSSEIIHGMNILFADRHFGY